MNRQQFTEAVAVVLTSWLKEAKVSVINAKCHYFLCDHSNNADLTPLVELGISVPKNHLEEKHWIGGFAAFDFFLDKENYENIASRIESERNHE